MTIQHTKYGVSTTPLVAPQGLCCPTCGREVRPDTVPRCETCGTAPFELVAEPSDVESAS